MSTGDSPSQLSPTELAKLQSQSLGAPAVFTPGRPPQVPQAPQAAVGQDPTRLVAPPGPDPRQLQQFSPTPGQYPPPMTPVHGQVQQLTPGQGVPMQQFVQNAGQGQPQRMTPEQFAEQMRALQEAQQREIARQQAEAAQAQVQSSEPQAEEKREKSADEESSPLLQSMDEDLASAIDRFNNGPRRKKIEAALRNMNVDDLVMKGELRQEVPISCGVKVVFRTTTGAEHDGMLDELGRVAMESSGSELFLRERLANYNLTLSIHAIGNKVLTSHLNKDGEFDVENFRRKFSEVMQKPLLLIADMRVNCYWFDERVRRIMVAEELGNG